MAVHKHRVYLLRLDHRIQKGHILDAYSVIDIPIMVAFCCLCDRFQLQSCAEDSPFCFKHGEEVILALRSYNAIDF